MIEIERKFLVNDKLILPKEFNKIRQGYISDNYGTTVRVRVADKCYITIKGKTNGISRSEFEYEIPRDEANTLLDQFCSKVLEKDRYIIEDTGLKWEIDVFKGKLDGLIMAEIELKSVDQFIQIPNWIDREVSYDKKYYNSNLINLDLMLV